MAGFEVIIEAPGAVPNPNMTLSDMKREREA
jgi:hypothetical protein